MEQSNNGNVAQDGNVQMPDLKLHGQIPITTNSGKRLCSELSPLSEINDDALLKRIETMIEKSMAKFVAEVKLSLEQSVKTLIDEHFKTFKSEMKEEIDQSERHNTLRVKCESEMLESYNRRENLRIVGMTSGDGYETNETTEAKVLELAKKIDANVVSSDISIAHRLPSKRPGPKPIIVRFARRIAKINLLRNKKKLQEPGWNQIRVYEDLTTARMRFFNLMKSDTRISNVWTREGTIHYIWKDDNNKYTINNLFEGGLFLSYDISDMENCFSLNRE